MTPEQMKYVQVWLKGDKDACAFFEMLFDAAHVCDDLTDRDKTVPTHAVQSSFYQLMVHLPRNPFYVAHFALLSPLVQIAFMNWRIANEIELDKQPTELHVAFILRSSYMDLITMCAWIIGGDEWALQVGKEARLHTSNEGFMAYCESLTKENRTPNVIEVS